MVVIVIKRRGAHWSTTSFTTGNGVNIHQPTVYRLEGGGNTDMKYTLWGV